MYQGQGSSEVKLGEKCKISIIFLKSENSVSRWGLVLVYF